MHQVGALPPEPLFLFERPNIFQRVAWFPILINKLNLFSDKEQRQPRYKIPKFQP